jgi:hypothetical protein
VKSILYGSDKKPRSFKIVTYAKLKRKEMELTNGWHEAIVSATIAAAWIFSLFGGYLSGKYWRLNIFCYKT